MTDLPTASSPLPPAEGGRPGNPRFYPVIHFASTVQTVAQAQVALDCGADGVFLVNMSGASIAVDEAAVEIKKRHPNFFVGINRLDVRAAAAIEANIALGVDATWTDDAGIRGNGLEPHGHEAFRALEKAAMTKRHAFFAAVAFKYQAHEPDPDGAARTAARLGWIPTTSGPGTGKAADPSITDGMRAALGDWPLGLASGVTPENIGAFLPSVTAFLVSTGIVHRHDEYSFDPVPTRAIVERIKKERAGAEKSFFDRKAFGQALQRRMTRYGASTAKVSQETGVPDGQIRAAIAGMAISLRDALELCTWLRASPYRYMRLARRPGSRLTEADRPTRLKAA